MPAFLRKYGIASAPGTRIRLPMVKINTDDFATSSDWTPVAGDTKFSKDGGTETDLPDLPAFANGAWEFKWGATTMECKTLTIKVVDQGAKAVEDQFVIIETYGHASAMHPFDLGVATQTANLTSTAVDLIWDEPLTEPATVFAWAGTMRNAFNYLFASVRNRVTQTATTTTLRNDANSATISTRTVSDDGTTFISDKAT